jgi:hypothetical protein
VAGRAQFIVLEVNNVQWGLLNIYAPNQASARAHFWDTLVSILPDSIEHWIVGGDFNMLEVPADRVGGNAITVHGRELAAWERLVFKLRILDVWYASHFSRTSGSLQFSRSSRCIDCQSTDISNPNIINQSRLDRFYLSDFFTIKGGHVGILAGTTVSDHAPVILDINGKNRKQKVKLRVPEFMFKDPQIKLEVQRIWYEGMSSEDNLVQKVVKTLSTISSFFFRQVESLSEKTAEKERRLRRSLVALQRLQERHPRCSWTSVRLFQVKNHIVTIEKQREEFRFHKHMAHWAINSDRCSKDFFESAKPQLAYRGIRQLRKDDGSLTTSPSEMRQIATQFYQDLLSAEEITQEMLNCRQKIWSTIRPIVTMEMKDTLRLRFTTNELWEAVKALPFSSCPGEDGLSVSFFLEYWDMLKDPLCLAFQSIFETGVMPSKLGEGLIFLIPKLEGPSDDIKKWRPITILSTTYKILAKAISLRLQPMLSQLIHVSQTGFLKERSILDNIFTFWETTAIALKSKQDLAVLFLDFEKAYDRVDWQFLQGTLLHLGFEWNWVKGIAALYSSATSRVLLAGDKGPSFQLSRSVRQGCPLAPFLFLFFAEAMSSYLLAQDVGIKGITIPLTTKEVLDAEFADDTCLFLTGHNNNLLKAEQAIQEFCLASGARINWNKTVGLWISQSDPPSWLPDPNFRWIPKGTAIRYLGCQIGVELSAEQQLAPLLMNIRRKLLSWSSSRLSLAGRVQIVNHVLLASMWYTLSCWIFSKSCVNQLQRLIRSYLWSGRGDESARAKVAWSVITLPTSQGGLGIIDPVDQSKALLSKLVVRSLQPGDELWKLLLKRRMTLCSPTVGRPWINDVRWVFNKDMKFKCSRNWEDKFINGIWRSWDSVRKGLEYKPWSCPEEVLRQPIVRNPRITTTSGLPIGTRTKLAWGLLAAGPGNSLVDWGRFLNCPHEEQYDVLSHLRGGHSMFSIIQATLQSNRLCLANQQQGSWLGIFDTNCNLILVKGIQSSGSTTYFEVVNNAGLLQESSSNDREGNDFNWLRIRVISHAGQKWLIDPPLEKVKAHWKLWAYEKRPLIRLQWDPGEYVWQASRRDLQVEGHSFFQYTVKLGRSILTNLKNISPASSAFWYENSLHTQFLNRFWKKLWSRLQPRKLTIFQWLIVHRSVAVGTWLSKAGHNPSCKLCGHEQETQYHCLWGCINAQQIWKRILRIFIYQGEEGLLTWGSAAWSSFDPDVMTYDSDMHSQAFYLDRSARRILTIPLHPFSSQECKDSFFPLWELLSVSTMWVIWKSRCAKIFDNKSTPPVDAVKEIWSIIIHTLKGHFDSLLDRSARNEFYNHWYHSRLFEFHNNVVIWNFTPPRWLFPPP